MSQTGRCLCGGVTYEVDAEPIFAARCHCRDCQRLSGSGYMFLVGYPEAELHIDGPLKFYTKTADSGDRVDEGFCSECGCRIGARGESMPGVFMIAVSSLDDPSEISPQMDIFTASAQHWDAMDASVPRFEGMPPMQ